MFEVTRWIERLVLASTGVLWLEAWKICQSKPGTKNTKPTKLFSKIKIPLYISYTFTGKLDLADVHLPDVYLPDVHPR